MSKATWKRRKKNSSAGNTPGTADYLVDDVHFGIIPEPTTAALLVGLLVVPLLWRRKNVL